MEPVRVDLVRAELPVPIDENVCATVWPFAWDPEPLSHDGQETVMSRLVEDGAAAGELRALRDLYLADDLPEGTCNLPLGDSAFLFYEEGAPSVALSLWLRDAVPLEGPGGGVELPGAF